MYDGSEHTPKLLPCSHTVCLQCLIRIVATFARDTGQFRCPICRELITIPRGGVQVCANDFLTSFRRLEECGRSQRDHLSISGFAAIFFGQPTARFNGQTETRSYTKVLYTSQPGSYSAKSCKSVPCKPFCLGLKDLNILIFGRSGSAIPFTFWPAGCLFQCEHPR